jgi:hypothetical protein
MVLDPTVRDVIKQTIDDAIKVMPRRIKFVFDSWKNEEMNIRNPNELVLGAVLGCV